MTNLTNLTTDELYQGALRAAEEKRFWGKDSGETKVESLLKQCYSLLQRLGNVRSRGDESCEAALQYCIKNNIRKILGIMVGLPVFFDHTCSVEKMFRALCDFIIKEEKITIL